MADVPTAVTTLLRAWRRGDQAAFERLTPLSMASYADGRDTICTASAPNHTLQPTALVHEVYLRMVTIDQVDWHDRVHFFAIAARHMRRILVDSARARRYQKRGGGAVNVTFDEMLAVSDRTLTWWPSTMPSRRSLRRTSARRASSNCGFLAG